MKPAGDVGDTAQNTFIFFAVPLPGLLTCPAEVGGGEGVKEIVAKVLRNA